MMGWLSKKYVKSEKKRNYIVIAFDILVIIIFLWWALNERASYIQGVNDCARAWCDKLPKLTNYNTFCPANYSMIGNMQNFSDYLTDIGTKPPKDIRTTEDALKNPFA